MKMLEVPRCEAWDFSVTCSRKESSCGYLSAERSITRQSQVLEEFHVLIDTYFLHNYSLKYDFFCYLIAMAKLRNKTMQNIDFFRGFRNIVRHLSDFPKNRPKGVF